jgi:hypothetical protein
LELVTEKNKKDWEKRYNKPPYDNTAFWAFDHLPQVCHERDLWAIGLLIFEMLVGENLMAKAKDYLKVKMLWNCCKEYMDAKIRAVLDWMLFESLEVNLGCLTSEYQTLFPECVIETMRKIRFASEDDFHLNRFLSEDE